MKYPHLVIVATMETLKMAHQHTPQVTPHVIWYIEVLVTEYFIPRGDYR